ncbi:hypothetical protein [Xylophilus sp. GOD-11R]|uniref:hypothetical protein n=1 Tax=Xylophilus sp. GOD-11R TaxID=3089814 RepID=UPI00298CD481|nr:hypothetical protein [Xylophilus sp. GOD-11R]WPB55029.1 hypothetical protein R9X41_12700 [Xylophilus sp. GOD-11R]
MRRVVVHIDRLVLTGLSAADPGAVARGLQAELARELAEPQALAQWRALGSQARLAGASMRLDAGRASHDTGVALARALRADRVPKGRS